MRRCGSGCRLAAKYVETNDQLVILDNISLGEAAEPYRVWVAKGDPKGLMDSINKTIASLDEETMASIIEEANTLSSQASVLRHINQSETAPCGPVSGFARRI